MADRFSQHTWLKQRSLKHRSAWIRLASTKARKIFNAIVRPQPVSLEYRQWRDRLIRQRFWLAIGLAVAYIGISGLADFYEFFINPAQLLRSLERNQLTDLLEPIRQRFFLHKATFVGSLGLLILGSVLKL